MPNTEDNKKQVRFEIRRGKAADWYRTIDGEETSFVLLDGEPGYEQDTGRLKIGDGVTPWADLPYITLDEYDIADMIANSEAVRDELNNVIQGSALIHFIGEVFNPEFDQNDEIIGFDDFIAENPTPGDVVLYAGSEYIYDDSIQPSGGWILLQESEKYNNATDLVTQDELSKVTQNLAEVWNDIDDLWDETESLDSRITTNTNNLETVSGDITTINGTLEGVPTLITQTLTTEKVARYKGELNQLPEVSGYNEGDIILVDTSAYILKSETEGQVEVKSWQIIGDGASSDAISALQTALVGKVDKNGTDSLMTAAEHTKLASVETNAEVNVIESISINSTPVTVTNKAVDITLGALASKDTIVFSEDVTQTANTYITFNCGTSTEVL